MPGACSKTSYVVEQSEPVPAPSPDGVQPRYQPIFTVSEGVDGEGFGGGDEDFGGRVNEDGGCVVVDVFVGLGDS